MHQQPILYCCRKAWLSGSPSLDSRTLSLRGKATSLRECHVKWASDIRRPRAFLFTSSRMQGSGKPSNMQPCMDVERAGSCCPNMDELRERTGLLFMTEQCTIKCLHGSMLSGMILSACFGALVARQSTRAYRSMHFSWKARSVSPVWTCVW
jgi:hypothetical protein